MHEWIATIGGVACVSGHGLIKVQFVVGMLFLILLIVCMCVCV